MCEGVAMKLSSILNLLMWSSQLKDERAFIKHVSGRRQAAFNCGELGVRMSIILSFQISLP